MSARTTTAETMLVVEDEEPSRRALQMLLKARGFDVRAVGSAEEALEFLSHEEGAPAYMVVDVDLPGMCGLDLVRRVLENRPQIHPMLVTAADRKLVQQFCTHNGGVDYFPKPLDVERFLRHLKHIH